MARVVIERNKIILDNNLVFELEDTTAFDTFIVGAYKSLNISYSKFYKMDNLCKLGFIATEHLFKSVDIKPYAADEVAVILSNKASSLDTDLDYYNAINDADNYFPSPAVFVYTLANIVIGEICIRHEMKGENAFFVMPEYDENMLREYADTLLKTTNTKICLLGWVDLLENDYRAELFLYQ